MLTREQIELSINIAHDTNVERYTDNENTLILCEAYETQVKRLDEIKAMALAWLEVQPRQISEAPEGDWDESILVYNGDHKFWSMAHDWEEIDNPADTHFIPLSSLPVPEKE